MDGVKRAALKIAGLGSYEALDRWYLAQDRPFIRRTRNIRLIPDAYDRRGGKRSSAEWAHTVGIFQTLLFTHLERKDGNRVLDVGCGTGLMGIACEPFLGGDGRYVGIDVMKRDIDFCRSHYPAPAFEFVHLDVNNPAYSPEQTGRRLPWPLEGSSFDVVTALSVWTHFNEEDALFYMGEASRVLKPGGTALITFFLMDEVYRESLGRRTAGEGRYHRTSQQRWVFDKQAYGSEAWFCPASVQVPERAIGVTQAGVDRLLSSSGLQPVAHHQGNWKEVPGAFFQDVLVLRKPRG